LGNDLDCSEKKEERKREKGRNEGRKGGKKGGRREGDREGGKEGDFEWFNQCSTYTLWNGSCSPSLDSLLPFRFEKL
jgi:hypothetical protein